MLVLLIGAEGPLMSFQLKSSTATEPDIPLAPEIASIHYPVYSDIDYVPDYGASYERELPTKQDEASIAFELSAEPSVVGANGELVIHVVIANNTQQAMQGLLFTDTLESGIELVEATTKEVQYDERTRQITFAQATLEAGQRLSFDLVLLVTARATGRTDGEIWFHTAELTLGGQAYKASVPFWFGQPSRSSNTEIGFASQQGGWVETKDTSIYFPENALAENAVVRVSELAPVERIAGGPALQFEIELLTAPGLEQKDGEIEDSQRIAVGAEIQEDLAKPALLEVNFDAVVDLSDVPAGMEPYVATYNTEYEVWVKAPVVAIDAESNTVTVEAAHFSTWGGGLGSSLPQNGAGALLFDQPYTTLFTGGAQYSIPIWTPPGRAGMQPSIQLSYSSRTIDGVLGDVQAPWVGVGWNIDAVEIVRKINTSSTGYGYQNEFALTFNGQEHRLVVDPANPARYYTERASFLYIERHNFALQNGGAPNTSGEWWEIVATDGTRYRLGWNEDSEQLTLMYGYQCTTGNPCTTPSPPYTASGYAGAGANLIASRWRVDRVLDTHGNFIDYAYAEEQPDPASQIPPFDRASYLERIEFTGFISGGFEGTVTEEPAYSVEFVLGPREGVGDTSPLNFGIWDQWDTQLLDRIDVKYGSTVVRTYDFGYTAPGAPNANGTLTLTEISVSGGGFSDGSVAVPFTEATTIEFGYENLPNRAVSGNQNVWTYPRLSSIENGYGGQLQYAYEHDGRAATSWYNYRVQRAEVESGLGLAAVQRYSYSSPTYTNQPSAGLGALYGYATVTESVRNLADTANLLQSVHSFGTAGLDIGRHLTTDTKDPGGQVLRRVRSTYVTDNSAAPFAGWNFRYLLQSENFEWDGSSLVLLNKTVYQRDPLYGNLLTQSEYLGANLYRTQTMEYSINPNPDVYILDRVASHTLRDANNAAVGETRYVYDGGAGLSLGELTLSQTLTGNSYPQSVDTAYLYDDFGNLVETRAYTAYGAAGSVPSGDYSSNQVAYDSTVHTFPVAATNALNQTSASSYLLTLGVAYAVTDPNGWTNSTGYDGLGRVVSTTAPGFGQANVIFTYPSPVDGQVAAPYSLSMQILDTLGPGAPAYRTVTGVYDGLSRILQQQVGGLTTVTEYNDRGLVDRQSLPYGSGETPRYLETSYDTLGRVVSSSGPGNIVTQYAYSGLSVTTIDPNGHRVTRANDGLGRMIRVDEYSGEHPTTQLYATTQYSYNIKDQLVQMRDAQNNLTAITYDWLGRKTSMDDPDMGLWAYGYDALGNLVQQTDARGQVLGFDYDALGRLIEKINVNASQTIAAYTYGSSAGEIGFRTAMSDQSGSTAWSYSNHGRTVTENRTMDGDTYSFTTISDWLGRVASIAYPDSEVVNYSYDALGRANGVTGTEAGTIAQLAYNSLSQITSTSLGNGVQITNTYDNTTGRLTNRNATNGIEDLIDFSYGYDPAGNITSLTDAVLEESFTYSYDHLNRLLDADAYVSAEPEEYVYRQRWEYDPIGNISLAGNYVIAEPPTPTETPSETPTLETPTPEDTPTPADTETPTETPTPTDTEETGRLGGSVAKVFLELPRFKRAVSKPALQVETETPTPSETPTPTETLTPSETPSETATDTPSITPTASATFTPSITPTFTPTSTATPVILAYWNMNAGSGSSVADSSGNNNNGTISGATWTSLGVSGAALNFDGVNDYVNVPNSVSLKPASSFTVSAWVYPTQAGGAYQTILVKGAWDYALRVTDSGYLQFYLQDVAPVSINGPILPVNTWTYVTGVYDDQADAISLYVNAQLVSSQAVTGSIAHDNNPVRIGSHPSGAQVWSGRLDEITIYNRALTPAEIAARYVAVSTPTPTPSNTPTITPTPWVTPNEFEEKWGTGADGDVTITAGQSRNMYSNTMIAGRTCADAPSYRVTGLTGNTATLLTTPPGDCLRPGDEILLINIAALNLPVTNVGNYEFLRVQSITGNTITFDQPKNLFYGDGVNDTNIYTNQYVYVQRVPNYNNLTVNGTLTTNGFNTHTTGVVAFRVKDTLSGSGIITAYALGYAGIGGNYQGRGIKQVVIGSRYSNVGGGGAGRGYEYSGGGGGHGTAGTTGTNYYAEGGSAYGVQTLEKIFHGGGGGSGHEVNGHHGPGGNGGGIVMVHAYTLSYSGNLYAHGAVGQFLSGEWGGRGGSGAGGSIYVAGNSGSLGALYAPGGAAWTNNFSKGGTGRIAVYSEGSPITFASSNPSPYQSSIYETPTATPTGSLTPTLTYTPTPGAVSHWGSGLDGDVTIPSGQTTNINTTNLAIGRSCADGGDAVGYSVTGLTDTTVTLNQSPSNGCLSSGDEVLLINLQGISSNFANVGNYEILRVLAVVNNTVVLTDAKTLSYGNNGGDSNIGTAATNQRVMLMRVPQYDNLTVNGTLTASAWNGSRFGILAFKVRGELQGTGMLDVYNLGYRGGKGGYVDAARNGAQGETYKGLGVVSTARNAGGGGGGPTEWKEGGGGNYGGGAQAKSGEAGGMYGDATLQKLYLGSGGGGGAALSSGVNTGANGGRGAGAILIIAEAIDYAGTINSTGVKGSYGSDNWVSEAGIGESGGGSGGSIRIEADSIEIGTLSAVGGAGGNNNGGKGGVGRIAVYYVTSFTYTSANPAPWSLQEGQPTPTPTATPTAEPTLEPGWHDGLYEYEGAQPHAVTRVERGEDEEIYEYDANGNMVGWTEGDEEWELVYNAENRLSSISDGTDTWTFAYDGDNRRVGQTGPTGEVTLYPGGGIFEIRDALGDAEFIKYYGLGGQRVAMQDDGGVKYLLADHLGSVSAVLDATGNLLSEQRYTSFGETRFEIGITETDFGYTGQRLLAGTGLMDYNARFYAPGLGRWTQPDTIVPEMSIPQYLNRFGYVLNNPVLLADPTGHCPVALLDGTQCIYKPPMASASINLRDLVKDEEIAENRSDAASGLRGNKKAVGTLGSNCTDSYTSCFYQGRLLTLNAYEQIDQYEFHRLLVAIYFDIKDQRIFFPLDPIRAVYDTPFWDGYTNDVPVCFEASCYPRSSVNYVAQGMLSAATGQTLNDSHLLVHLWNIKEYAHAASPEEIHWTTYGHLMWFQLEIAYYSGLFSGRGK